MDYFEDEDRLYEFAVLSEATSDDYSVECFDMASDGPGLVGTLRVAPDGRGRLELRAPITVRLLHRWLDLAESEAGLAAGDGRSTR